MRIIEKLKGEKMIFRSLAYVLTSFLVNGISFITTPIYTRMMGAEAFGIAAVFTSWFQFFATFMCLQLSAVLLTAKMNRASQRFESYTASIIRGSLGFGIIFSIIIVVFRNTIAGWIGVDKQYIVYLCICSIGICMVNMYSGYCIAAEKVRNKVAFSISWSVLMTAVGLTIVSISTDKSFGRIVAYTITYAVVSVFIVVYFLRKPLAKKDVVIGDIQYAMAFGVPLVPHLLSNIVNGNADRVFILKLLDAKQAGIYSVVHTVGMLALYLADATNDAWNPWYYQKSKEGNIEQINKYFVFYSVTIAMCFFGVMMLSPEILLIMGGKEYLSGTSCISYIALGVFFMFMYRFPLSFEQLHENTKFVAVGTIGTALINIVLNSVMIPAMGINGAALASTISYFVLWIAHELIARKIIKQYDIKIINYIIPFIVAILGFVLSELLLKANMARYMVILFFCLCYLCYAMILFRKRRVWSREEQV